MDPSLLCKAFFITGTAVGVGGTFSPSFRQQIMDYGSRTTTNTSKSSPKACQSSLEYLFNLVASLQVPHTWFIHYYLASVTSSIFWAIQIYTRGRVFRLLSYYNLELAGGMTVNQVLLAWAFMMVQGTRRLYECITLTKPSQSKMWVGLWLIGIGYYLDMGLSVWIEGITALNTPGSLASQLDVSAPSVKTYVAVLLFVLGSAVQHDCHVYLASLKKYTLPQRHAFRLVICPHYTGECLIYVALAIVAAPTGHFLNPTVLAGLSFVISNLAVTADSTRKWYIEKFGAESLNGRWRMVPYVY